MLTPEFCKKLSNMPKLPPSILNVYKEILEIINRKGNSITLCPNQKSKFSPSMINKYYDKIIKHFQEANFTVKVIESSIKDEFCTQYKEIIISW